MTAATLSRLPLSAGGSALGMIGRAGGWFLMQLVELVLFVLSRFFRAPIAITTIAVIAGLSLLAGSNALFFQTGRHPAPLFFSPRPAPAKPEVPARPVTPVIPAPRFRPAAIDSQTTGSVGPAVLTSSVIGSDEVKAVQEKLVAMHLLDDTPDGIFGRHTAAAIKAFETKAGMRPAGKLTPELLVAVLSAAPAGDETQSVPAVLPAARPAADPIAALAAAAPPAPAVTLHAAPVAPVKAVPLAPLAPATQQAAPPAPAVAALSASPPQPPAAPAAQPASLPAPASTPQPEAGTPPGQPLPSLSAAQRLAQQMGTLPPQTTDPAPAAAEPVAAAPAVTPAATTVADADSAVDDSNGSTDPVLISKIQRGLASLGFLGERIDGVPGEGTAKAIRNFEVFYDYKVTGLATHKLLNLLVQHGAVI